MTVEETVGRGTSDASEPAPGESRVSRAWPGMRGWLAGMARRHLLFSVALGLAVVPRVIVMLGYQPAILFRLDSYDYLWDASHLTPNVVNPSGYSLLLWLLRPLHSLILVTSLQHLLGLGIAVLIYAVLRHLGVRGSIATLAAAPVLFASSQLALEQMIMADLLALALMIAAFAVLLLRSAPSVSRSATAGVLMGASAVVRPTALALIVVMALYLLIRRAGWRRAGAALAAGALPVIAYAAWFASANGSVNLTNSNGLFLWSRTMSFADCSVIKPAADLQALCPTQQPGLSQPVPSKREQPKRYLWNHNAWQWQPYSPGLVTDTSAFTAAKNKRAQQFAIHAIEAQPLGYAKAVTKDTLKAFTSNDEVLFPRTQPTAASIGRASRKYALAAVRAYDGSAAGIGPYLGVHLGTRLQQPYADLVNDYQRVVFLPAPLFTAIVAVGLAGLLIPRRRSAAAAMLWASAVIAIVLPIAEHEYTYRYVVPAIPLACMAAALACRSRPEPDAAAE